MVLILFGQFCGSPEPGVFSDYLQINLIVVLIISYEIT